MCGSSQLLDYTGVHKLGSVAQFVGNFGLIFALRKFFYGFLVEWRCCGRKSLVFDRMGARAKARRLAPLLV
jgi:hypothetical protein